VGVRKRLVIAAGNSFGRAEKSSQVWMIWDNTVQHILKANGLKGFWTRFIERAAIIIMDGHS